MNRPERHRAWARGLAGVLVTLVVAISSACSPLGHMFPPKEDPKAVALQREVRQIEKTNALNQRAVRDIYQKLNALESRLEKMDGTIEKLASRPEPILITPGTAQSALHTSTLAEPGSDKANASTAKTVPPPPTRKKSAVKKQKQHTPKQQSAEQEYDKAYAVYLNQRFDEARSLFKKFLKRHPKHHLSDNAQYWIGEIYYDTEDFPNAILAFKEVATKYPDENKAPDALLKIGYAYTALDDPNNARVFLKRVIKNYPFSQAETKARAKLKELENLR